MESMWADLVPLAIGIAISPIPIIATILVLLSPKAKTLAPLFLIGWILGIVFAVTVFMLLRTLIPSTSDADANSLLSVVRIVVGISFGLLAVREWKLRPKPGEEAKMPGWMAALDQLKPAAAVGLAFALAAINPKNMLLAANAGLIIAGVANPITAVIGFTAVAIVSVAVPVIAFLLLGKRIDRQLEMIRGWLVLNGSKIMVLILLVLAIDSTVKGISAFL